ncbi:hypothetical protein BRD19_00590 [Halobacteriales archaeon SW_7_65_23]|nr:MAG: hypothetical protein BRD19_00590 [Halobacteriales archaeon SW_7_65_23]
MVNSVCGPSLAETVSNRLELGEIRTVVTGTYTDAEQLRARSDIKYVERDEEMQALDSREQLQ